MKRLLFYWAVVAGSLVQAFAANVSDSAVLKGIINVGGTKRALFEFRPSYFSSKPSETILAEGDKDDYLAAVEIHPEKRSVKVDLGTKGGEHTLKLGTPTINLTLEQASIELDDASLEMVLNLYDRLAERTLLRWPSLPPIKFFLRENPKTEAEAASVLKQALADQGIDCIPDGPRFMMVVPTSEARKVHPHALEIAAPTGNDTNTNMLDAGYMVFKGADISQVAEIYADMLGGNRDRSQRIVPGDPSPVYFRIVNRLYKVEVLYAMETLFSWRDLKLVPATPGVFRLEALESQR